ncbi:hypothetical protein DL96DRAFT_1681524 [Flagelloscypha sp. PMI_526]|nr:hypothetical protein DL96DRAFT_1681524 [Flagelloscypha sp. PMI_526]
MASPPNSEPREGLRVLSLDGPGLNTSPISELFFLTGIAHRWAYDEEEGEERDAMDVKASEMFDLIGGTGVGGFYAVLFTAFDMRIGQVIECHNILHQKVFASQYWAEKDREGCSRVLDEALDEMLSLASVDVELDSGFLSNTSTKCFIAVLNSDTPHMRAFRSYRIRTVPSPRCTLRQVLHATLADTEHLPHVRVQDEEFVSASVRSSNPSRELMKELTEAFPKNSYLACFVNLAGCQSLPPQDTETVAQDLALQCKNLNCFFRLSVKAEALENRAIKSSVMQHLQSTEISQAVDDLVEALLTRDQVVSLQRLINLAGENGRTRRDNQINAIRNSVEHLQDAHDQSLLFQVKDWLKPINQTGKLDANNRSRGATTCEWFLREVVIEDWIKKGGVCWFHGGMGKGKTVIMSHLIQTMIDNGSVTAYYYFEFTNASTLTEEALLRSLLSQLSPLDPSFVRALYHKHRRGALDPQLSTLQDNLLELAERSLQPFYIVVDALDELPPPQRKDLFVILKRMCQRDTPNMHVIIASRDEMDIKTALERAVHYQVDVSDGEVRHDIAVFVDQELGVEKWKNWPPSEIERMRAVLNERAAGQFRMVACQLEVLHQTETTGDLRTQLNSLPKKLTDTYLYILNHIIPEAKRKYAKSLLSNLISAFDAIPLNELTALLAVDMGDAADIASLPSYQELNSFHEPQNIVGLGTAFVSVVMKEGQLFLDISHASVKEYLLQQDTGHWCYMDEKLAHSAMAGACLALLLHRESIGSTVPVSRYVKQLWFKHVQPHSAQSVSKLLVQQLAWFDHFPWSSGTQFQLDAPPHNIGLGGSQVYQCRLTAAAAAGLFDLVRDILDTQQPKEDIDHALYVTVMAKVELYVMELLIEKGSDINQQSETYGTLLQIAACQGNLELVEFLVGKGADVNKWGGLFGTPLQAAAWTGALDVMNFLVEKGAYVNRGAGPFGTPLQTAAFKDVNQKAGEWGTALQAAACEGDLEVVEFLIEKGADIKIEGGLFGTALQAAEKQGHGVVARFLIERSEDVDYSVEEYDEVLLVGWDSGREIKEGGMLQMLTKLFLGGLQVTIATFTSAFDFGDMKNSSSSNNHDVSKTSGTFIFGHQPRIQGMS